MKSNPKPTPKKRPRGRPRVGSTPINVRLPPWELSYLDAFIRERLSDMARPQAIRSMMRFAMEYARPPKWGEDELTKYCEAAYQSRWATFYAKRKEFKTLMDLDRAFVDVSEGWKDPRTYMEAFLFLCCHSAFRAACDNVLAGQISESYPQMRSCIEYAGYAIHMNSNPGLADVWAARSEGQAERQAAKKNFRAVDVEASVRKKSAPLGKAYLTLYNRTIDYGAHPNEAALFTRMRLKRSEDGLRMEVLHLQGDGAALNLALRSAAQIGILALRAFREIFKDRFIEVGLERRLPVLMQGH